MTKNIQPVGPFLSHVLQPSKVKRPEFKKQNGMTLIELLVAMTIGLFMLIALALVYSSSKTGFSYTNNTVRMSEDASFALEMMSRDIRMAGFAGCTGSNVMTTAGPPVVATYTPKLDLLASQTSTLSATQKPNPFSGVIAGNLLQVFTARNAIWGFAPNDTAALGVLGGGATSYTLSTTNPVLYLAGGSSQALQVNTAVAGVTDNVSIAADTYNWANNPNSTFLIISDCKGSEVFRASSISAGGGIFNIAHADTANDSASFANTYGADAIVTTLNSSVYFLATRAGASTPSLYRRYFNGSVAAAPEELVPNVEAIVFQYGENTSDLAGVPTYRTDIYRTNPADVADWSRVVSVRMGLIMVAEENGQAVVANQSVAWIGGTYTPATNDRRLRRAYSTTVSIRNRMGL
jgi:type IV pilus assembly protein PilW